jgi:PPK2 family polyphosphate:nucleotide phosphotransferase
MRKHALARRSLGDHNQHLWSPGLLAGQRDAASRAEARTGRPTASTCLMAQSVTVKPGKKVDLADFDPAYDAGISKEEAAVEIEKNIAAVDELCYRLYAEGQRAVLLVLQGMDTAGKDGVIRKVLSGVDPVNCRVTAFKRPSTEELSHDFLWRIHKAVPPRGDIGIFNRSHYEDVLAPRVHALVPASEWKTRYDRINDFEKLLVESGTTIVKCFLHISKTEQRGRLQARLESPKKRWKFKLGDLVERKLWDEYQSAYADLLTKCNTDEAPWNIVPSDRKWYRDLLVSRILREALEKMNPQFPPEEPGLDKVVID